MPELSFVATQVNNRLMVYPAQIFLFVGVIYLILCTALDVAATWLLARRRRGPARADGACRAAAAQPASGGPR